MISAAAVAEPAVVAAAASAAVAALDEDVTAVDVIAGTERRTYANNVDISDPHRNFTSDEWDRLGSMRSYVLQLRDGRGGRGRGDQGSTTNRTTTSSVAAANTTSETTNATNADQSVVSEITERGSQNGRSFGRGAYNT